MATADDPHTSQVAQRAAVTFLISLSCYLVAATLSKLSTSTISVRWLDQ